MSDEQFQLLRQVRLALQSQEYDRAIHYLQQVIELAKQRDDLSAVARHLGNLALTYYRMGQPVQALDCFEQALMYARKEGDRATEDGLLGNMGNILREMQRYDEAIQYLNDALSIAQEIGDKRGRGIWLSNLGLVYDDLGQHEQAITYHQQAIEVARQLFDQPSLGTRLGNLAASEMQRGHYQQALDYYDEAVSLYQILGREHEADDWLLNTAHIYVMLAEQMTDKTSQRDYYAQALEYYEQTLQIAHNAENDLHEAQILHRIAHVLIQVNQKSAAIPHLKSAIRLYTRANLPDQAAQLQTELDAIKPQQQPR